jgi:integrase
MARGGSIYERRLADGSTSWAVMYRSGGRQIKFSVRGTRADAEKALTARLAARDRGEQRQVDTETFAAHAAVWLASKRSRVESATMVAYTTHLDKRLLPAFGHLKLRQITRARLVVYLDELDRAGELNRHTINKSLTPLRQILARAVREGVIASNPAVSVDRDVPLELPYKQAPIRPLTAPQARAYLEGSPTWYRPMAEVLLGAGLRIGEALGLEWRDLDRDASTIRVERAYKLGVIGKPKFNSVRTIAIDSAVIAALSEHRKAQLAAGQRSSIIFAAADGQHRKPDYVRDHGHLPALADAGLPASVRLHDLRHTAATLWLAAGASIYFVQQQLGHGDLRTTIKTYGHPDQAAHRQAAESAAAWWRAG